MSRCTIIHHPSSHIFSGIVISCIPTSFHFSSELHQVAGAMRNALFTPGVISVGFSCCILIQGAVALSNNSSSPVEGGEDINDSSPQNVGEINSNESSGDDGNSSSQHINPNNVQSTNYYSSKNPNRSLNAKYDDEQTYLDLFGERAKELLTQHIIPSTDAECRWDHTG